jgi:hypothetical protein
MSVSLGSARYLATHTIPESETVRYYDIEDFEGRPIEQQGKHLLIADTNISSATDSSTSGSGCY